MTGTADVCVIGGGILGVSAAYHASAAGLRVVLLEAHDLASGATGHSFGGVSASVYRYSETRVPEHYASLSLAGRALFARLADELGPPLDLTVKGELDTFEEETDRRAVESRVEGLREYGVDVELLDGDEARVVEPALSDAVSFATFCRTDSFVSPQLAVWALADAAARNGAEIRTGVRVTAIKTVGDAVVGVTTSRGEISCGWVVLAAGAGTPALARSIGAEVPLVASRGQMFVTERMPPLLRTHLHNIKQTAAGTVLIGATVEPGVRHEATTAAGTGEMLRRAVRLVPGLARARLLRSWAGVRTVPPDGYPMLGALLPHRGLLVAVMHRGITLAPVVGRILTDLMVDGGTSRDIAPYDPLRFGGREAGSPEARVMGRPDYVY